MNATLQKIILSASNIFENIDCGYVQMVVNFNLIFQFAPKTIFTKK